MNIKLLSAYAEPSPHFVPHWLACHCDLGSHRVVEAPEDAELIIFAETYASLDPFFFSVLRHPVYRRFSGKCVLYHYNDVAHTLCRTVSPSVEKHQPNLDCRRSFHYIARRRDNSVLDQVKMTNRPPRYLFSFVGSSVTHPIRKRILSLKHAHALLKDTSSFESDNLGLLEKRSFHSSFVDTILDSMFVLCPRGIGPTSMRLFEALQLGRVPVVIGDTWVPVPGVDWSSCALFVPESDVSSIPHLLEQHKNEAEAMGHNARQIWKEKFAPQHAFLELVAAGRDLINKPHGMRNVILDLLPISHPKYWRTLLGCLRRGLRR